MNGHDPIDGKRCPACTRDVGFRTVLFRPSKKMKCPHCGAEIEYVDWPWSVMPIVLGSSPLMFTVALGVAIMIHPLSLTNPPTHSEFFFILGILEWGVGTLCIPLWLVTVGYLRSCCKLQLPTGEKPRLPPENIPKFMLRPIMMLEKSSEWHSAIPQMISVFYVGGLVCIAVSYFIGDSPITQ